MTAGGFVFMAAAWGFVIGLSGYCFYMMFVKNGGNDGGEG